MNPPPRSRYVLRARVTGCLCNYMGAEWGFLEAYACGHRRYV